MILTFTGFVQFALEQMVKLWQKVNRANCTKPVLVAVKFLNN